MSLDIWYRVHVKSAFSQIFSKHGQLYLGIGGIETENASGSQPSVRLRITIVAAMFLWRPQNCSISVE